VTSRVLFRGLSTLRRQFPTRVVSTAAVKSRPLSSLLRQSTHQPHTLPNASSHTRTLCTKGEGMIINIQDEKDFEDRVINSDKPVVADFHATWCGPCKILGPRLEAIIGGKKGKVVLAKIDVDDNMEVASKYKISSIPTVIGFKNQKPFGQFIGLQDDDQIDTFIEKLMG
ncbi:THIOM-like protein, partial [Mya arenaria]